MSSKIVRFPITIDQTPCTETANGLLNKLSSSVGGLSDTSKSNAPSVKSIIASIGNAPTYNMAVSNLGDGIEVFNETVGGNTAKKEITYKRILATPIVDEPDNVLYVTQDDQYIYFNTIQSGDPEANARTTLTLNGGVEQEASKVRVEDFTETVLYRPILHNAKLDDTIGKILIRCDEAFHDDIELSIGVIGNGMTGSNTIYKGALVKKFKATSASSNVIEFDYGTFFYDKTVYIDSAFTDKDIYLFITLNGTSWTNVLNIGGRLSVVFFFDRGGHKQWSFGGIKESYSGSSISSDAIWAYNLKTNVLTRCRSMATSRSSCMQVQTGLASYVIGGLRDSVQLSDLDKFTFSTEINSSQVSSTNYNIYDGCSTSHKSYGVLLFGRTDSSTGNNNILKFNYNTNVSSTVANSVTNVRNAGAGAENYNSSNMIYAYGGVNIGSTLHNNNLFKFDLTNNTISVQGSQTSIQLSHCDMQVGFTKAYIFGGLINTIDTTDTVLQFVPAVNTISTSSILLPFAEKLVSQCSKLNSNKTEITIISNRSVQKIDIVNSTSSIRTEMNVLDADTDMVCATSHLI